MSEIEKRLRENRRVSNQRKIIENSFYKVGDRVKIASGDEEPVEIAEILGIEEAGLYRVKIGDTEYTIEEIYLKPIDVGFTKDDDVKIEEKKKSLLRAVHTPMTTARPQMTEGENYKVYYTRDILDGTDDSDSTGTVLIFGASDEDDAIQKAVEKVMSGEIQDLNPRNFRIAHKIGDKSDEDEETFDDLIVESKSKKSLKEYELVGTLAPDEIEGRYSDLRDSLNGRFWDSIEVLIDHVESQGFLTLTYTDEFLVVSDLEDQTPNPAEHMIPIKLSKSGQWVVRD